MARVLCYGLALWGVLYFALAAGEGDGSCSSGTGTGERCTEDGVESHLGVKESRNVRAVDWHSRLVVPFIIFGILTLRTLDMIHTIASSMGLDLFVRQIKAAWSAVLM